MSTSFSPDDFLTKVDRASMSCGLEVRPPLVDHELLELTAQIPSDFKVRNGSGKWIFKEAYRHRIPAAICERPKQGFEIPVDRWLRGPLRELFTDTVLRPQAKIAELLDQSIVRRIHQSHLSGSGRNGAVLWAILVLSQWCERYLSSSTFGLDRSPGADKILSDPADLQGTFLHVGVNSTSICNCKVFWTCTSISCANCTVRRC